MKWPWNIYPSWQLEYGPSWNVKGGRNYDDYKYPLKRVVEIDHGHYTVPHSENITDELLRQNEL